VVPCTDGTAGTSSTSGTTGTSGIIGTSGTAGTSGTGGTAGIILHSRWDVQNESVIISAMNIAEEKFLYWCEAIQMPYTMK